MLTSIGGANGSGGGSDLYTTTRRTHRKECKGLSARVGKLDSGVARTVVGEQEEVTVAETAAAAAAADAAAAAT